MKIIEVMTKVSGKREWATTTEATNQTSNAKMHEFKTLKIPDESQNLTLGSIVTARKRKETMLIDSFHPVV